MFTQKLVLSYSTKIVVQIVQMATSLIVARLVGPSVLGALAFGLAFVSMFTFISDFGMSVPHFKFISEGRNEEDCNRVYASIKVVLIALFTLVVIIVFVVQKYLLHYHFESINHEKIIFIYLIIIIITQLFNIVIGTWAAKMEQAKQDIPNFLQTLFYQLLRLIIALLGYKAVALALGNLTAVLITVPIYLYLARDMKFGKFDKELFKEYMKVSFPVIVIIICQTLLYSTDKVILQYFTNSVQVGYYSAAFALGSFIKTIESSAGLLLFPYFSKFIATRQYDEINGSLKKFERFTFAFIIPLAFTFAIFSDIIIRFTYGAKFIETIPVFSIIIISFIISLIYLPYGNIIFGMGLFKTTMRIWIVNLITFFIFNFILVSPAFFNMKAIGTGIAILISNLMMFLQLLIIIKIKNKQIKILQGKNILFISLVFYGILFIVTRIFSFDIWFVKLFIMLASYFLFLLFGSLIGVIKKDEFLLVFQMLNIRKMKTYIMSEIFHKKDKNK